VRVFRTALSGMPCGMVATSWLTRKLHASSEQLARGASGRLHAAVVTEPTNLEIRAFRIGFKILDDLAGLRGLFRVQRRNDAIACQWRDDGEKDNASSGDEMHIVGRAQILLWRRASMRAPYLQSV